MIAAADLLGVGLYSPSEAGLYARVRPEVMSRWVYGTAGTRQSEPVFERQFEGKTDEKIVTFLDFVSALAVRRLRVERHLSLQKIRAACIFAKDTFNVKYPFAMKDARFGLFGPVDRPDRQDVFLCLNKPTEEDVQLFFQLTGNRRGNQLIGEVVMSYARFLEFDSETKLASRFTCFRSEDGHVTMDPEVRFGAPFIDESGYTAQTLYESYQAEGTFERAAKVYDVDPKHVRLAADFYDFLNPAIAA